MDIGQAKNVMQNSKLTQSYDLKFVTSVDKYKTSNIK